MSGAAAATAAAAHTSATIFFCLIQSGRPVAFVAFSPRRILSRILGILFAAARFVICVLLPDVILFGFGLFVGFVVAATAAAAIANTTAMPVVVHTIAIHGDNVVAIASIASTLLEREQRLRLLDGPNAARRFRSIEWKMDFSGDRRRMRCRTLFALVQIDIVYRMMLRDGVAVDDTKRQSNNATSERE